MDPTWQLLCLLLFLTQLPKITFKFHKLPHRLPRLDHCHRRKLVPTAINSYLGMLYPVIFETCTKLSQILSPANFARRCFVTRILWDVICGDFTRKPKTSKTTRTWWTKSMIKTIHLFIKQLLPLFWQKMRRKIHEREKNISIFFLFAFFVQ